MREYLEAFALGNGAILGNVCMLPLYPGLVLMLANRGDPTTGSPPSRRTWHLGVVVLGGVLTAMIAFGAAGLGFGWPLVVLPLVAAPAQRRMTRRLARHHRAVTFGSGVLLIVVALFELWKDVLPNVT